MFFSDSKKIAEAYAFDDVLLKPAASNVLPGQTDTRTKLTRNIELGIPIIAAAMDTVTEAPMAIAMAQSGGIGVIHRNMELKRQVQEVEKVKKFESGMVVNPITIHPDETLADALKLMADYHISGIPVVERNTKKLVGILTNRDVRFASQTKQPISELMTKEKLITVKEGISHEEAKKILHQHRIEKLLVVDDKYRCIGLITVKDMEKAIKHPHAVKDDKHRLRAAAAVGTGKDGMARAEALMAAEIDLIVLDTAHGHSSGVIETARQIRKMSNYTQIMAGNVATGEATKALIDVGVDAVKVGIGPGSICTTRMVAGVGVPQLSAILACAEVGHKNGVPVIADGGIRLSGDIAKAIAAGASCVMIGSLLAGTDESPGEVFLYQGRSYKSYRGMGSLGAMADGSADRYFQKESDNMKFVPEGVEGMVPYKGAAGHVLHQLVGGLRAAMGYTGNADIAAMQKNSEFIRITGAGLRESHVHDITITREAPNYKVGE
jgi:IMP dehydrogenase